MKKFGFILWILGSTAVIASVIYYSFTMSTGFGIGVSGAIVACIGGLINRETKGKDDTGR